MLPSSAIFSWFHVQPAHPQEPIISPIHSASASYTWQRAEGIICCTQAHCRESQAFVLSGNREATQWLRMRADARIPLVIGGVDCRLIKYTVRGLPARVASRAPLNYFASSDIGPRL